MISTFKFGNYGRLGNQIFQYAFLYGMHRNKNYKIGLTKNNCQFWNCFETPKCVSLYENYNFKKTVSEVHSCTYDQNLLNQPDDTMFVGYFQSYKYFDKYKNEFKDSLIFKNNIIAEGEQELLKYGNDCVSLHIRRGDYTLNPQGWGDLISENYYIKSLELIPKDKNILVFTDDIPYVKDYFNKIKISVNIIDKNEFVSLYMMTKCNYHIIASSSYSWMGAYLSNSKNIICPQPWWPKMHGKDLTKENWTHIKVFNN